jgi:hypothetical protein
MKHIVTIAYLLFATPAFSADIDKSRFPGATDLQRVIDGRPDPNSLSTATQPPEHATMLESPDKTPPGESLSPKLNPPGLEFKKSF